MVAIFAVHTFFLCVWHAKRVGFHKLSELTTENLLPGRNMGRLYVRKKLLLRFCVSYNSILLGATERTMEDNPLTMCLPA